MAQATIPIEQTGRRFRPARFSIQEVSRLERMSYFCAR